MLSDARRPSTVASELLLQKNLHVLKVKGHRIVLQEIGADHAGEVEAKCVFPRERPIVETRDVVFLYVSEGKSTHGVRHDWRRLDDAQRAAFTRMPRLAYSMVEAALRQRCEHGGHAGNRLSTDRTPAARMRDR